MSTLTIQPDGLKDSTPCECCGNAMRSVWGFVYENTEMRGVYFVRWTLKGVPKHGATFELLLGPWNDTASAKDRCAVELDYRLVEGAPQFTLRDASGRSAAVAEHAMTRAAVLGTPLAQQTFNTVDAILEQDARVKELMGESV